MRLSPVCKSQIGRQSDLAFGIPVRSTSMDHVCPRQLQIMLSKGPMKLTGMVEDRVSSFIVPDKPSSSLALILAELASIT